MPELPEVERAARLLESAVRGKRIVRIRALHPALARGLPPSAVRRLKGRRIERVERRGKHQLLHLDDGSVLHAHFRMTGDWAVDASSDPPDRFARAVIDLDDDSRVSLIDPRALATLRRYKDAESALPTLGPEPLDPAFDAKWLERALSNRRGPIKPALLDQRVAAGVGNIYASEALWEARIDPRKHASELSPKERGAIVKALRTVLRRARPGDGRYWTGSDVAHWRVYDREGEPCPRCGTAIERIVQAGRSTYFCPRDQSSS
jgi:formamidopyrimidine-DNA glycosylase